MKKGFKILKAIGCVAAAAVVGLGVWQLVVHQQSKKYNLVTLDTSSVPQPVAVEKTDSVELSEITMHYDFYGENGHPLILIHGNGGSRKSLAEAASYLANDYSVYVIESRCHGESTNADEISYDLMAKDIKEFIEAMKLEKPYLMGHSDGGINVLTLAYLYPEVPGAIISCGANSTPDEFKPYFTLGVKAMNLLKPDKLNDLMLTLPQFNEELLSKIICPTYIVAGEFDIMWLSDSVFLHEAVRDSKLTVIRGANHSSYISQDGKQAYVLACDYFKGLN